MRSRTVFWCCLMMGFCLSGGCVVTYPESSSQVSTSLHRAPLDGIWKGQFHIGSRGPFDFTAVHVDGKAYAYSQLAKGMCVGTVELDGENYTSTYVLFVLDGGPFDYAKLTGKVTELNEITSHFVTVNGGDTGALNLAYDAIYDDPSSLALLEGAWSYTDRDHLTTQFSISPEGTIQGQDSDDCRYLGQVEIIDPSYNVYKVVTEISGCSSVDGKYEGVSFLADDQLSVQIANARYALYFAFDRAP